jgi:hypothetical protein
MFFFTNSNNYVNSNFSLELWQQQSIGGARALLATTGITILLKMELVEYYYK